MRVMSRLPFELQLALRYLKPKRTFVSTITLISVLGVTLGVGVLIIVISVMSGFDQQMRDKILGFKSHLRIQRTQSTLRDYDTIMDIARKHPNVRGAAPYVWGKVLVEYENMDGVQVWESQILRGLDPELEASVSSIATNILVGEFDFSGRNVIVGVEFARNMGLFVGDTIAIYSPGNLKQMKENHEKGTEEVVLPDDYAISGIFDVGYYDYNSSFVLTSLWNAQDLYNLGDSVHGILITLDDPFQAIAVRNDLKQALPEYCEVITWLEEDSSLFEALLVEKQVMFYLLFFIMIVAAFGIMSAMITFVVQKTREIGALKSLGASDLQIMAIFLGQSLIVGVFGSGTGLGLGLLAVRFRNEFLLFMRNVTGFELFPADIYQFTELPALVIPSDIVVICVSALVTCVLAGVVPAWSAGKLKPVEALRHE